MNFEQARFNMIEQQIRTWQVLDQRTLDLFAEIHREDFFPDTYKQLALADVNIPLLHDQVTMTPKVEARLLQSLSVQDNEKVLEIGTGCGYLTALLARSADEVHSVDIFPVFTEQARSKFAGYRLNNIHLHNGDASHGWQDGNRYDVIVVTGSVPVVDNSFRQQLRINGRLFIIAGESPVMEAMLITRIGEQEWAKESLFETDLPALVGASKQKFEF
ncbi:MAG: protein-L-isoaspartate O-methyltransferase [Gammaproteobacteria bacterium]|nr:protein-L-isoaspartate O-methyltransferase [Gammaproteobacteria bacterium]